MGPAEQDCPGSFAAAAAPSQFLHPHNTKQNTDILSHAYLTSLGQRRLPAMAPWGSALAEARPQPPAAPPSAPHPTCTWWETRQQLCRPAHMWIWLQR